MPERAAIPLHRPTSTAAERAEAKRAQELDEIGRDLWLQVIAGLRRSLRRAAGRSPTRKSTSPLGPEGHHAVASELFRR
jgi:hypothetical protein